MRENMTVAAPAVREDAFGAMRTIRLGKYDVARSPLREGQPLQESTHPVPSRCGNGVPAFNWRTCWNNWQRRTL